MQCMNWKYPALHYADSPKMTLRSFKNLELAYDAFTVTCLFLCTFLFGSTRIPPYPCIWRIWPLITGLLRLPPAYIPAPLLFPSLTNSGERSSQSADVHWFLYNSCQQIPSEPDVDHIFAYYSNVIGTLHLGCYRIDLKYNIPFQIVTGKFDIYTFAHIKRVFVFWLINLTSSQISGMLQLQRGYVWKPNFINILGFELINRGCACSIKQITNENRAT